MCLSTDSVKSHNVKIKGWFVVATTNILKACSVT